MKLTRNILEQLVEETIEEMAIKIVKFSPQDMEQLHKVGQVNKDGVYYQYEEPVQEGTCGYGENGELGEEPAGPHLIKKEDVYGTPEVPYDVKQSITKKGNVYKANNIYQVKRPEGRRFYSGKGSSKDMQFASNKARFNASDKAIYNPSDSLSTANVKKLNPDFFKEDKQDITQQMADIEKKKNISKKDKKKLEKLAKMMAKANESYSYKDMIGLNEGKKIIVKSIPGRKIQLDLENEAQAFIDGLKRDNKKISLKNISDYIDAEYKFFNSPKLNHQVFNYIKKNLKKLSEATIHHSQMRIIYVPKKDIKKALKVIKSMPFSLKGKVEVEKKPSDKVRNHFRIITTKQLFNPVVEYLATANIGVKTISKGKM